MKSLIGVLFICAVSSLAQGESQTCLHAAPNDGQDVNNPVKKPLALKANLKPWCDIFYKYQNGGCVVNGYYASDIPIDTKWDQECFWWGADIRCYCFYDNCNADLRPFYHNLTKLKNDTETVGKYTDDKKNLLECMLEKSKELAMSPTTTKQTTTIPDLTTAPTTTQQTTTIPDTLTSPTNTTEPLDSSSVQQSSDEKSSLYFGLFIGSTVFNVLLVVTMVALIVALVKKKKKGGEAKQGVMKTEQKGQQTHTAIHIEKPVTNKDSSTVPPPPSTTKAADQKEAAADTTGTDLDTTGSLSGSDSTGPDGFNEVRWSVRGFKAY